MEVCGIGTGTIFYSLKTELETQIIGMPPRICPFPKMPLQNIFPYDDILAN